MPLRDIGYGVAAAIVFFVVVAALTFCTGVVRPSG